ncbi:MAG: hypothetical protein IT373_27835 [Polyangiaceae bacterium]|nr:hypothetical protein [Polyangiaceae bacterium]
MPPSPHALLALMAYGLAACSCGGPAERPASEPAPASAAAAATATASSSGPSARATPAARSIDVAYEAATDSWRATWAFAEPTPGILFDRRSPSNRHEAWKPEPGLHWVMDHGSERLSPDDGAPRTEFTVTFPTDDDSHGRAPPLNLRFSNGDRLLFTSQLGVHALTCVGDRCDRRDVGEPRGWRFHTDAARGLRVLASSAKGELAWDEPRGDLRGTYLYVGDLPPVDAGAFSLLLDPGLPEWLRRDTERLLPELVAFHAREVGIQLDLRPFVFASRGDASPSWQLRGRTLPALIQLEAKGVDWNEAGPQLARVWFEFLAHETFHLWNAQLARRAEDARNEWLSEGSAIYVAGLALRHAKLLDDAAFDARILRASNGCLATLKGPLFDAAADASYYDCGEMVEFVIDRHLAGKGGVLGLLAATFELARGRGTYATSDYLTLLEQRATDAAVVADVRAVLDTGLGADPPGFVARVLGRAGLPVELAPAKDGPKVVLKGGAAPAR